MAIRDKIEKNAAPHLNEGEVVQATFVAQTRPFWWMFLGGIIFIIMNRYRTVIATDQRILVCDSGRWMTTKAKSIIAELPRTTRIGPASGLWYETSALGEQHYVHKRFHKDINAADQMTG